MPPHTVYEVHSIIILCGVCRHVRSTCWLGRPSSTMIDLLPVTLGPSRMRRWRTYLVNAQPRRFHSFPFLPPVTRIQSALSHTTHSSYTTMPNNKSNSSKSTRQNQSYSGKSQSYSKYSHLAPSPLKRCVADPVAWRANHGSSY